MDFVMSIDVTPWAVASFVLGMALGGVVAHSRDVSTPVALLSSILALWLGFSQYTYGILVTLAWFLAIGLGGFAVGNYIASWYRRLERTAHELMQYMEALRMTLLNTVAITTPIYQQKQE